MKRDGKSLSCLGQQKNGVQADRAKGMLISKGKGLRSWGSRGQLHQAELPHWPGKMAQREQKGSQQLVYFIYSNCKGPNKVANMHISHVRRLSLDDCKGESKLKGN